MSNLRRKLLTQNPKTVRLSQSENFDPMKWSEYFNSEEDIGTCNGIFHIYKLGNAGPALICLHGGGYSGLTWALFAVEITKIIDCQVIAIDLRGHGSSKSTNDYDLSLETLANDIAAVLNKIFDGHPTPVVFIGHSMGGAVAVQCCYQCKNVVGLCIIDIVEGTALDSLSTMQSILRARPKYFTSQQHAIQWCYTSGQTHNLEAAKVSMPGQILNKMTRNLAANECDTSTSDVTVPIQVRLGDLDDIEETPDDHPAEFDKPLLPGASTSGFSLGEHNAKYVWRIDLTKTEKFWKGWFQGLSKKFLDVRTPKLLLLANIHGMDTALTVGQMQGKFQLQVLSKSGHAIHEDQPQPVAEIIASYLVKQKITSPKCTTVLTMPGC